MGASAEYGAGHRAAGWPRCGCTSRPAVSTRRPKLGEEPTRTMVGDVNAHVPLRAQVDDATGEQAAVHRTPAPRASSTSSAEAAISLPNPNTQEDRLRRRPRGRRRVRRPEPVAHQLALGVDSASTIRRGATRAARAGGRSTTRRGEVKRGYLNPTLDERERNDGLTVLELGFDRQGVGARRPDRAARACGPASCARSAPPGSISPAPRASSSGSTT